MRTILFTSDWHADHVTCGVPRFAEVERAALATVRCAVDRGVDVYIFGGDLCDPDANPYAVPRSIALACSVARDLAKAGITSYWMTGNHDVIEDGSGDSTLQPLGYLGDSTALVRGPILLDGVLFLPFTATSHPYDPAAFVEALRDPAGLVVSHLAFPGIQPGEETTEMPRGREVVFPVAEVARLRHRFNVEPVIAQAHYHRAQSLDTPAGRVHVPGSLARLTFGEQDHTPGFLVLVDVIGRRVAEVP